MLLRRLRLYNFRCYSEVTFEPDERFNVISGLNGQGKTSLLEAIGLLAFLKSFRGAKNNEMLRNAEGVTEGLVTGTVEHRGLSFDLGVRLWPTRKLATFNGKSCKYLSEYAGKISAVSFCPTDLDIIRGGPEERRQWIDRFTQVYFADHVDLIQRYNKVLDHRNRLLRHLSEGRIRELPEDFSVWSEELIKLGAEVIHRRIHTVDKSVDKIRKYYDQISDSKADINIEYFSENLAKLPYGLPTESSLELIGHSLREKFAQTIQRESVIGSTLVGPHRDEILFTIGSKPNAKLVRSFGSQGEVRSLVLSMRLSEVDANREQTGADPIFLVDDFSSELDLRRRNYLLDYLSTTPSQVFLSTTENFGLGKHYQVSAGRLVLAE